PYHRESRRIDGVVRFTINHISDPYTQKEKLYRTAIGVGDYPVDHHHTRYEGWEALPDLHFYPVPSYGLPLGTLIPKEQQGLIVAEKSISVTNLVNGTTRLQPVVLQIGEAAGVMAALASAKGSKIADVPVRDVQTEILKGRGYLLPYLDLPVDHPHFKTLQRVGVTGIIKGVGLNKGWENQTWFYADSLIKNSELAAGLKEFYDEALGTDLKDGTKKSHNEFTIISSKFGDDNFVTLESISQFISLINKSYSPDQTKELQDYIKLLKGKRALTRLDCAVLIDKILNPFENFGINFRGEILNPAQTKL
ncbi:MAG: FAD-dependent oxidoreductase, partial [Bacteroidales bacterium]|nr:FAD-dependent oxidoreductase [Bacteroidales bacterium]